MIELAMRNADQRRSLPCLILNVDGSKLVVENTEDCRREAVAMIFGDEPFSETDAPTSVIVSHCMRTQEQLDALPEWEP